MKVGQLFSMIELDGLPEEQRTELESRLATLRDDVPPVPFARLEKLMREELGAPLGRVFADRSTSGRSPPPRSARCIGRRRSTATRSS